MSRTSTTLALLACAGLAAAAAAPALPGGGGSASEPVQAEEPTTTTTTVHVDDSMAPREATHVAYREHRIEVAYAVAAVQNAELERQQAEAAAAAEAEAAERERWEASQPEPEPEPQTRVETSSYNGDCSGMGDPANNACWDRLAQCESGGNWAINTGNGYSGGLQFAPSSWTGAGGSGMAYQASRSEQIRVARNLWASGGWGHWPACTSGFGWR